MRDGLFGKATAPRTRWMAIAGLATAFYGAGNLFQPTVVCGNSMEPTLRSGKLIWVDRTHYAAHKPQRGEVVVFRRDGVTYVKRVYRGPGETVHFMASGPDFLSAVREGQEGIAKQRFERRNCYLKVQSLQVPEDCVFVMGDNFNHSEDSRHLGPIPIRDIIGRAHLEPDHTKLMAYEIVPSQGAPSRRPVAATAAPSSAKAGQPARAPGVSKEEMRPFHMSSARM